MFWETLGSCHLARRIYIDVQLLSFVKRVDDVCTRCIQSRRAMLEYNVKDIDPIQQVSLILE